MPKVNYGFVFTLVTPGRGIPMVYGIFSEIVSATYEKNSPKFLIFIFEDSGILIWSNTYDIGAFLGH